MEKNQPSSPSFPCRPRPVPLSVVPRPYLSPCASSAAPSVSVARQLGIGSDCRNPAASGPYEQHVARGSPVAPARYHRDWQMSEARPYQPHQRRLAGQLSPRPAPGAMGAVLNAAPLSEKGVGRCRNRFTQGCCLAQMWCCRQGQVLCCYLDQICHLTALQAIVCLDTAGVWGSTDYVFSLKTTAAFFKA